MLSPIKAKMVEAGVSRTHLALLTGLSLTTVEYVEKGMFANVPETLLRALDTDPPSLQQAFAEYKLQERLNCGLPRTLPEDFPSIPEALHPHTEWRILVCDIELNKYCDRLKIHRSRIQLTEGGGFGLPYDVYSAILMGCGAGVADRLREACHGC